ncbi:MAG TPA: viperin family antiviral radical SAM protein [Kofleriaceae bacterium]|nr:viperin family antiviral radical SAM protein [Kofleriaceae bacterium]
MQLPAVNFHLWKYCNYKCRFCFATFEDVPGRLQRDDALKVIDALGAHGCGKITFVGGEPTLCPFLPDLVERAHALDITTCVVSNGAKLAPLIEHHARALDWIGLSIDSCDEATSRQLGRGTGEHIARSIELADLARGRGIRLKLNTVVTARNHHEDMTDLVRRIGPERWKVFQVLPIRGQNDGIDDLLVTGAQFTAYLDRHRARGLDPIAEDNEAMTGSYIMIDPMARFFDNVEGRLVYGRSILDVGVADAFESVRWERKRMIDRGGIYPWRRR